MTEPKKVRAVLIDPVAKTVSEVEMEYNGDSDYKKIYPLLSDEANGLKVDCFDVIHLGDLDAIFVDDEGLLRVDEGGPEHYFQYKGVNHPTAGRGLILGSDDEGSTVSAKISLDEVRANVSFPRVHFVGFLPIPEGTTRIGFDGKPWPVIGHTPVFEPLPEDAS